MRIGRLARGVAATLILAVAGLAAYECYAVWRAWTITPAVVGAALAAPMELSLADLPLRRRAILLAVEDPGFEHHRGVDFASPGQGMTTITQGLVKRFYFHPSRPGFAKIEQSLIARFVLHPYADKDQQLALFLNHAYFGHLDGREVTGFADAARTWFDTEFRALTEDQFIALVAMIIGPNALDPKRHLDANRERVARIRQLLAGECRPSGVFDPWYERCAG